jgi:hypothetical protein
MGHKITDFENLGYYFWFLGKLVYGPYFSGYFEGALTFFDPFKIFLEMAHRVICPQKKYPAFSKSVVL